MSHDHGRLPLGEALLVCCVVACRFAVSFIVADILWLFCYGFILFVEHIYIYIYIYIHIYIYIMVYALCLRLLLGEVLPLQDPVVDGPAGALLQEQVHLTIMQ